MIGFFIHHSGPPGSSIPIRERARKLFQAQSDNMVRDERDELMTSDALSSGLSGN